MKLYLLETGAVDPEFLSLSKNHWRLSNLGDQSELAFDATGNILTNVLAMPVYFSIQVRQAVVVNSNSRALVLLTRVNGWLLLKSFGLYVSILIGDVTQRKLRPADCDGIRMVHSKSSFVQL